MLLDKFDEHVLMQLHFLLNVWDLIIGFLFYTKKGFLALYFEILNSYAKTGVTYYIAAHEKKCE